MTEQIYDHKGTHAIADIMLNSYPANAIELFQESLKYCNLNIVAQKVHQFTDEAATGIFVLSESSADIHEYPEVENGYICVSVFTCGNEGDPEAAIQHFLSLLDVKDVNVKCFNRGHFNNKNISMAEKAFGSTRIPEINKMQEKMDKISKSLTPEQSKLLEEVMDWVSEEKACEQLYYNEVFD